MLKLRRKKIANEKKCATSNKLTTNHHVSTPPRLGFTCDIGRVNNCIVDNCIANFFTVPSLSQSQIPYFQQPISQSQIPHFQQPMLQSQIPHFQQPISQSQIPHFQQPVTHSKISWLNIVNKVWFCKFSLIEASQGGKRVNKLKINKRIISLLLIGNQ